MTFKGTVTSLTANWWATGTKVNAGDTYVVGAELSQASNTAQSLPALTCHIGDLLVAANDQSAEAGSYPRGIVAAGTSVGTYSGWYLISTGYDEALDDQLQLNTTNNTISLMPHVGDANGSVAFTNPHITTTATNGDTIDHGTNIEITSVAGAIQFNLVWAEF